MDEWLRAVRAPDSDLDFVSAITALAQHYGARLSATAVSCNWKGARTQAPGISARKGSGVKTLPLRA